MKKIILQYPESFNVANKPTIITDIIETDDSISLIGSELPSDELFDKRKYSVNFWSSVPVTMAEAISFVIQQLREHNQKNAGLYVTEDGYVYTFKNH